MTQAATAGTNFGFESGADNSGRRRIPSVATSQLFRLLDPVRVAHTTRYFRYSPLLNRQAVDEFRYDHSEAERARAIFREFAERAFRGAKPNREFIDRLANIYATHRKANNSFDSAGRLGKLFKNDHVFVGLKGGSNCRIVRKTHD